MTREIAWPDSGALLDELAEDFAQRSADLVVVSAEDLAAGFERARLAWEFDPDLDLHDLAVRCSKASPRRKRYSMATSGSGSWRPRPSC